MRRGMSCRGSDPTSLTPGDQDVTRPIVVLAGSICIVAGLAGCASDDALTTPPERGAASSVHNVVVTPNPLQATQRAGFGLPPGQTAAPNTPGGGVVVGQNLYTGDGANGFRHWKPADPSNPDPVNSGILVYDGDFDFSLGGTELCVLFCQVGQIAYDGNRTVYLASYDHAKGQPFSLTQPGVWRIDVDPVMGFVTPGARLAPNFGLQGNQPTSIALGPDGNLYIGFLKNGNIVRLVNPTADPNDPVAAKTQIVQSVGTAPNGRPVRSVAFIGPDLYLGTTDGLSVIRNAVSPQCLGGCNGVPVADGFAGSTHVGLTSSGDNTLYMSINGSGVWRYTISTQTTTLIATGGINGTTGTAVPFAFVGGHSNLLQLDVHGNLWIGDDVGDGALNFDGRIWYLSAASLASVP
jgi:hypothetical protein